MEQATVVLDLGEMPQLAEMRNPEDDWTGLTKAAERRQRQNRLNQRAYRRRKHAQQKQSERTAEVSPPSQRLVSQHRHFRDEVGKLRSGHLFLESPGDRAKTYAFMQEAYVRYSIKSPKPTYLPSLIRLNVLNALSTNAAMLGLDIVGLCRDDFISPFNFSPLRETPLNAVPECFHPTPFQLSILHHPWIDLFPIPRLRDNMLRAVIEGTLDEDEMCHDLMNVLAGRSVGRPISSSGASHAMSLDPGNEVIDVIRYQCYKCYKLGTTPYADRHISGSCMELPWYLLVEIVISQGFILEASSPQLLQAFKLSKALMLINTEAYSWQ
ncbi:hypothetical protein G7046_g3084 [Stylonectria norvegica]|nr:hypothetical protein G7046_g3084 [Stylonectria norvegica]